MSSTTVALDAAVERATTVAVAIESVLHSTRLAAELVGLEYAVPRQHAGTVLGVLAFAASTTVAILAVDLAPPLLGPELRALATWLPTLLFLLQCTVSRIYAYALVGIVGVAAAQAPIRIDWLLVAFFAAQLCTPTRRANVLRTAATAAFLAAATRPATWQRHYLAIVGNELAAWATERYMLPWCAPAASTRICCGTTGQFALGFFVGVYMSSGRESTLLLRPDHARAHIRGVALYGERAYLRYAPTTMGVLLAYLEGLQLLPFWFTVRSSDAPPADGACATAATEGAQAPRPPRVLHLHVACFSSLLVVALDDPVAPWRPPECARRPSLNFACASRFPFRRLLAGLLLRLAVPPLVERFAASNGG